MLLLGITSPHSKPEGKYSGTTRVMSATTGLFCTESTAISITLEYVALSEIKATLTPEFKGRTFDL